MYAHEPRLGLALLVAGDRPRVHVNDSTKRYPRKSAGLARVIQLLARNSGLPWKVAVCGDVICGPFIVHSASEPVALPPANSPIPAMLQLASGVSRLSSNESSAPEAICDPLMIHSASVPRVLGQKRSKRPPVFGPSLIRVTSPSVAHRIEEPVSQARVLEVQGGHLARAIGDLQQPRRGVVVQFHVS